MYDLLYVAVTMSVACSILFVTLTQNLVRTTA